MKIGITLAGGGAKGAYQIGVLKSLEEFGLMKYVSVISGTSVGALNAVLYTQGYDKAKEVWDSLLADSILSFDLMDKLENFPKLAGSTIIKGFAATIIKYGIFGREGVRNMLEQFDLEEISNSVPELFVSITKQLTLRNEVVSTKDHSKEDFIDLLLASSAIPIIFPIQKYRDKGYWDGGISNNFPISTIKKMCDFTIGVDLSARGKMQRRNNNKCNAYISSHPNFLSGKTLNFDKILLTKLHDLGYYDTTRILLRTLKEERERKFRFEMNKKKKAINKAFLEISQNFHLESIEKDLNVIAKSLDIDVNLYTVDGFFKSEDHIKI